MGKVHHCSTSGGRILSTTPCSFPDDDRGLLPDNPDSFLKIEIILFLLFLNVILHDILIFIY